MEDTPDMIRQQMEETKSQLTEKLESLELQVAETVQSTGTAVAATAEAVQETVETVTDAVHDAVQSMSGAFDLRRQFERHPWLVLGGAAVVGYVLAEMFPRPPQREAPRRVKPAAAASKAPAVAPPAAALAAAYESGRTQTHWEQLKVMGIGALISLAQDVTARAVPQIIEYVAGDRPARRNRRSNRVNKVHGVPRRNVSAEDPGQFRIVSTEIGQARKSR